MRTKLSSFFSHWLQFSDRPLQNGDLRGRVACRFQLVADLILQVGGIADAVDEEVKKAFGRQQALFLELVDSLVAHGHIGAADMEDHVVVASFRNPLKSQALHRSSSAGC